MVDQVLDPLPPAATTSPRPGGSGRSPRPPWRSRLSRWEAKGAPYAFVTPFFVVFAIFGAFPMVYTFWVSLHRWDLIGDHTFTGLENYRKLLSDQVFWNATLNTFGIFLLATVPQFLLALRARGVAEPPAAVPDAVPDGRPDPQRDVGRGRRRSSSASSSPASSGSRTGCSAGSASSR